MPSSLRPSRIPPAGTWGAGQSVTLLGVREPGGSKAPAELTLGRPATHAMPMSSELPTPWPGRSDRGPRMLMWSQSRYFFRVEMQSLHRGVAPTLDSAAGGAHQRMEQPCIGYSIFEQVMLPLNPPI